MTRTVNENVTRYTKPIPPNLAGYALGGFPGFVFPRLDEMHYQKVPEMLELLKGKFYYITEKCDGSSTTAYRNGTHFGVCSRNLELLRDENNGYWKVALEHRLDENFPDGMAFQWETCGPGIQSNPMGLKEIQGFAFNGYNIKEHRYLEMIELMSLCDFLKFPMAKLLKIGNNFDLENLNSYAEGKYSNGKNREGIVIRSQENLLGHAPVSFKVINLMYDK